MRARFFRGQRGSMLVLAAIVLPVLLAIAAVSLDAGYMYDYKQRMGAAADAAALGGAFEIKRAPSADSATLNPYIRDDAARNGFTDGVGGVTIAISRPPVTGLHIGDTKYVEVVISRPTPTFFAQILGRPTVTVSARAVAGPDEGTGCVYALNTNDPKDPIEFITQSGTVIDVPNCDIVSNGDFTVPSGATLSAHGISVSGTVTIGGTVTPTPVSAAPSPDPFADMDQAGLFGTAWTCGWTARKIKAGVTTDISGTANFLNGIPPGDKDASYVLDPGVYCGNGTTEAMTFTLTNSPAFTVTLNPGVYIANGGGLDWKHNRVRGDGVVFYLTASTGHAYASCGGKILQTDPPDDFILRAPTATTANFKKWTGTNSTMASTTWTAQSALAYEGLLFIQDRNQGTLAGVPSQNCTSNPIEANMLPLDMILDGAFYFPNHHILWGAKSSAAGLYTILIGGTLEFKDKASFNSNFTGLAGGSPIKRPGLGE